MDFTTSGDRQPTRPRRGQFSLRSLLAGLTWVALILAICLNYQHAATRQRQKLESLKSAGLLERARLGWQPMPPAPVRPDELQD